MPNFQVAIRVARATPRRVGHVDLAPYEEFLQGFDVGETVDLPLAADDRPRAIKRRLTIVAKQAGMRLRYPASGSPSTVRFKVMPLEKRKIRRRTTK